MKKETDTKDSKNRRIMTAISSMELGETKSPTSIANISQIHPDTFRDILDLYESLNEVGFEILRDTKGKAKAILRTDENLNVKNDIRAIRQDLNLLSGKIDTLIAKGEKK